MKLSDVMGAAQLSAYAEWALALFMLAFVAAAARVIWRDRQFYDDVGRIPLEDGVVTEREPSRGARNEPASMPDRGTERTNP